VPTTSSIREEKKPEKTISFTPAPSMKKTPTFGEKTKRNDDKKPDILKPKKIPSFGEKSKRDDDKKPDILTSKRTPSFGGKDFIETDDIRPETPKPKILPLVDDPTTSSWPQPPPPPPPPQPSIRQTSTPARPSTRPSETEAKADTWEREELKKIKER